jgi:hypothetical protein
MTENVGADARPVDADQERADEVTGMIAALRGRRALVDAGQDDAKMTEDAALERFANAAVAIEVAWTEGARRVEELELEAERVRDAAAARAAELEADQRAAIVELAHRRPAEDVAMLLGLPTETVTAILTQHQAHTAEFPPILDAVAEHPPVVPHQADAEPA